MSGIDKINCNQAKDILDDYFDRELSEQKNTIVEHHLSQCEPCKLILQDIEAVSSLLRGLPAETLKRDFANEIDALLDGDNTSGSGIGKGLSESNIVPFKPKVVLGLLSAVACMLLLAFTLPGFFDGAPEPHLASNKDGQSNNKAVSEVAQNKVPDTKLGKQDSGITRSVASNAELPNDTDPVQTKNKQEKGTDIAKPEIAKGAQDAPEEVAKLPKSPLETTPQAVEVPEPKESPKVIATREAVNAGSQNKPLLSTEAIVAFDADEQDNLFSQMGIGTDEDGLYAIKL